MEVGEYISILSEIHILKPSKSYPCPEKFPRAAPHGKVVHLLISSSIPVGPRAHIFTRCECHRDITLSGASARGLNLIDSQWCFCR